MYHCYSFIYFKKMFVASLLFLKNMKRLVNVLMESRSLNRIFVNHCGILIKIKITYIFRYKCFDFLLLCWKDKEIKIISVLSDTFPIKKWLLAWNDYVFNENTRMDGYVLFSCMLLYVFPYNVLMLFIFLVAILFVALIYFIRKTSQTFSKNPNNYRKFPF